MATVMEKHKALLDKLGLEDVNAGAPTAGSRIRTARSSSRSPDDGRAHRESQPAPQLFDGFLQGKVREAQQHAEIAHHLAPYAQPVGRLREATKRLLEAEANSERDRRSGDQVRCLGL